MKRPLLALVFASLLPLPASAAGFSALLDSFVEQCGPTLLEPGRTFAETDFAELPSEQVSWSEDGKMVSFTDGSADNYTIYWYSDIAGQVRTTCSRSISGVDVSAEDINSDLRSIEDAIVVGGLHPLVYASGENAFSRVEDTHTWQVELPQWQARGVAFHVQFQSSTITLTAFGGLSNSN
ncbi:MAG: hypothetical protein RIC18_05940 [Hoeflea sp.]|uniref:hypothetical protein n=1 Tax=Hoeflea sp. TaxID=1940281 RepID=UPI0032EEDA14